MVSERENGKETGIRGKKVEGGKVSGTFSTRRLDDLFQSVLHRAFQGEL
jgi:hypothetical protein